ncbi:hypothetical protein BJP25_02345 [Actinokineospora bangkokensis]|uniref:DUF2771 domain-containing protein n=1 Tax=Actinokineospora bangkokensis TaxID=1193682 RepID=A0A1Q9LE47_9PSEU|nr:hypothetical protein BJP25_02345 [Actinokineospora bangkokensis]
MAATTAVLAGCAAPSDPEVTFYADGHAAAAGPNLRFDLAQGREYRDPDALVSLRVRPDKPVQISVPAEVSDGVWAVAFSYLDAQGQRVDGASKAFYPSDNQHAFTLTLPPGSQKLLLASVQKVEFVNGIEPLVTTYWNMETPPE